MNYSKLEDDIKRKTTNWNTFAKSVGITGAGLRKALIRHTLRIDILEKICEKLRIDIISLLDDGSQVSDVLVGYNNKIEELSKDLKKSEKWLSDKDKVIESLEIQLERYEGKRKHGS